MTEYRLNTDIMADTIILRFVFSIEAASRIAIRIKYEHYVIGMDLE